MKKKSLQLTGHRKVPSIPEVQPTHYDVDTSRIPTDRTGLLPVFHTLRGLISSLIIAVGANLDFLGHLDQGTTTTAASAQAVRHSRSINAVPLTDLYTFHRLDYPGDAKK
jgi:hypothetical protein